MNFETLENDLGQEKFASPLLHVQWWRMMTDEAQMFKTVWKSKFYGVFVLDATPARWRGDAGSSPLDRARTAASLPRNDLVKDCRVHPTHWLISTQDRTVSARCQHLQKPFYIIFVRLQAFVHVRRT